MRELNPLSVLARHRTDPSDSPFAGFFVGSPERGVAKISLDRHGSDPIKSRDG